MQKINHIQFRNGSKEELLPNLKDDFPYICSYVDMNKYIGGFAPWHWHKEIELFYIEKGTLEYYTPQGKLTFSEGAGGIINSNVLHMTKTKNKLENTIQFIHIFDTTFLSGHQGSRIDKKYITPFITATQIDIIPFFPTDIEHIKILKLLNDSFKISNNDFSYELKLRTILCEIWIEVLRISDKKLKEKNTYNKLNDKLKMMIVYINEHYSEKIAISEIATSTFVSERDCFRIFHDCLHITPSQYLRNYRIQKACYMLSNTKISIIDITHLCGFSTSSYFGKTFKDQVGCSPLKYRQYWQNNDIIRQK